MWPDQLVGVEGEGKLGYVFSVTSRAPREGRDRRPGPPRRRLRRLPLPQFGLFIGFMVF
jgi:hypothetical protein